MRSKAVPLYEPRTGSSADVMFAPSERRKTQGRGHGKHPSTLGNHVCGKRQHENLSYRVDKPVRTSVHPARTANNGNVITAQIADNQHFLAVDSSDAAIGGATILLHGSV